MTNSQAYKRYNSVLYRGISDPKQIVSLLLAASLKETAEARIKLENGSKLELADNINRSVEILAALRDSIDENSDKETVDYLKALYGWLIGKLLDGFRMSNIEDIEIVERYLSEIHRIWNSDMNNGKDEQSKRSAG